MKQFFLFLAFVLLNGLTYGQGFNYQSIVRNDDGDPQPGRVVFLKFDILEGSPTGTVLYSETQDPQTDAYGWFSVEVGSGIPLFGNITDVNWNSGPKYLRVECGEGQQGPYAEITTSQINNSAFRGPQGIKGEKGDKGDPGEQGQQGPAGAGISIVGTVPNEASLDPNYNGNNGDIYITEDTGSGFVWNGDEWIPIGQLQGPEGPQGIAGTQGSVGPQGPAGVQGPAGAQGPQGPQGDDGPQGATG
ncbi:MAG: hypothetical protein WBB31_15155, partial [Saprospiraceae bacterium]